MGTVKYTRLEFPARIAAAKLSTLLAVGIALAATPALSQGAMTPGGGAMTPQPRVAPAAPTVAPTAPAVVPTAPVIPMAAPGAPGGPTAPKAAKVDGANSALQEVSTTRLGSSPGSGGTPTANNSNKPIPGVDVVVKKKPSGATIPQPKTDSQGQLTFKQLAPGDYDVQLPSVPGGGAVSMTTFVNGKLQSRMVFPVGSSVGTFAVAKAEDTVILKFETVAPNGTILGTSQK